MLLQIKQLPQPLGLRPAHRDLRLPLVVHAQLITRLEPRHHFANVVDIHHKSAMRPPEERRIQQFQQLFQRAAFRVPLESSASPRESRPRRWPHSRSPPGPPAAAGSAPAQSASPAARSPAPLRPFSSRSSASSCDSIWRLRGLHAASPFALSAGHSCPAPAPPPAHTRARSKGFSR